MGGQFGKERRRRGALVALVVTGAALAGCSSSTSIFSSSSGSATPESSAPVSVGSTIAGFITGSSDPPPADSKAADDSATDCPRLDIRQGASTLMVGPASEDPNALGLQYQGVFTRAARECRVRGTSMAIKIGVQGRVILGPGGGPGDVTVPLRLAIVKEHLGESQPIWTKLYVISITIPPGQASVTFSKVEDDVLAPIKPADVDDYVIYVGFDPQAAKPAAPARKPARGARQRPVTQ